MAENILYADLNLPESTRPRILTVPDVQGSFCTYAEVKVKSQDTNAAANCKSSDKSCCSRKHVAILVVIILVLVLAIYLIITYGPSAGSSTTLSLIPEEALGCSPPWKKHGRKCYFFSPEMTSKDWKASREECTARDADLVIIDSKEELSYLFSQSKHEYYLLGLRYSQKEQEWKWINNKEHDPDMFRITRLYSDYECMVIGFGLVQTAPCGGSSTTLNMCEKAATVSESHQKES